SPDKRASRKAGDFPQPSRASLPCGCGIGANTPVDPDSTISEREPSADRGGLQPSARIPQTVNASLTPIRASFNRRADIAAAEHLAPSLAAPRSGQSCTQPLQVQLENLLELVIEPFDFDFLGHLGPRLSFGNSAAAPSIELLQAQLRLREHRFVLIVEPAQRVGHRR